MRSVFSLLSGGLILAALAAPAHAQSYQLTDLGILPGIPPTTTQGITQSGGTAVNSAGQVAGYATQNSPYHAFLFEPGGGPLKDLGTLGGANSRGQGVNASGQVVGYSDRTGNSSSSLSVPYHAFLSGPDGGPLQDLGTLGGLTSTGMAVNDAGQVTGGSLTAAGVGHAFLSGPDGGPLQDLGTLGGTLSAGAAVNRDGRVAGYGTLPGDKASHAFLSGAGGGPLQDLGTFGTESVATGVNNAGQAAGYSVIIPNSNGPYHAFLFEPGGGPLQDLGALGGAESFAYGVNASGLVVGDYTPAGGSGARTAFRFSGGAMRDLNDLILPGSGFTAAHASGISDTGFITGAGVAADGGYHAFLLKPVAEAVTAYSQGVTTLKDTPAAVTLAGSDPNGQALTYAVTAAPAHGALSGTGPDLTYTPAPGYSGSDRFTFTVSAGASVSETATVSLAVLALASLTVPTPAEGGAVVPATVSLSAVTPVALVVGLSGSDSSVVRVHRAVVIPAGASSATFPITTYPSHVTKTVTIKATLGAMLLTKGLTITGR